MNFEELQELVLDWADDKDLLHGGNIDKQFMKFIEEVFEFKTEMDIILNCTDLYKDEVIETINRLGLEMGDIFVTLIILCEQLQLDPVNCLDMAYKKINKRKGKTIDGVFVKEEDL